MEYVFVPSQGKGVPLQCQVPWCDRWAEVPKGAPRICQRHRNTNASDLKFSAVFLWAFLKCVSREVTEYLGGLRKEGVKPSTSRHFARIPVSKDITNRMLDDQARPQYMEPEQIKQIPKEEMRWLQGFVDGGYVEQNQRYLPVVYSLMLQAVPLQFREVAPVYIIQNRPCIVTSQISESWVNRMTRRLEPVIFSGGESWMAIITPWVELHKTCKLLGGPLRH